MWNYAIDCGILVWFFHPRYKRGRLGLEVLDVAGARLWLVPYGTCMVVKSEQHARTSIILLFIHMLGLAEA